MVLAFMGSGGVAVFVHSDGEVDQPQPKKSIVNCASNAIQSLSSQGKLSCIVVCHLAAFLSAVPCILQFLWQCQVMHILRACIDASALLLFAVEPSPRSHTRSVHGRGSSPLQHRIAHQRFHGHRSCPINRCSVPTFCTLQLNIMTLQCGCRMLPPQP